MAKTTAATTKGAVKETKCEKHMICTGYSKGKTNVKKFFLIPGKEREQKELEESGWSRKDARYLVSHYQGWDVLHSLGNELAKVVTLAEDMRVFGELFS